MPNLTNQKELAEATERSLKDVLVFSAQLTENNPPTDQVKNFLDNRLDVAMNPSVLVWDRAEIALHLIRLHSILNGFAIALSTAAEHAADDPQELPSELESSHRIRLLLKIFEQVTGKSTEMFPNNFEYYLNQHFLEITPDSLAKLAEWLEYYGQALIIFATEVPWAFLLHLDHYPIDLPDEYVEDHQEELNDAADAFVATLEERLLDAPVAERAEIFREALLPSTQSDLNPKEAFWDWAMRTRAMERMALSADFRTIFNFSEHQALLAEVMATLDFWKYTITLDNESSVRTAVNLGFSMRARQAEKVRDEQTKLQETERLLADQIRHMIVTEIRSAWPDILDSHDDSGPGLRVNTHFEQSSGITILVITAVVYSNEVPKSQLADLHNYIQKDLRVKIPSFVPGDVSLSINGQENKSYRFGIVPTDPF